MFIKSGELAASNIDNDPNKARRTSTVKQIACLRAARKTATYRSPRFYSLAALVPSAGIINFKLFAFGAGAIELAFTNVVR